MEALRGIACEKMSRISLDCKLVSVQYREYEYGVLKYFAEVISCGLCTPIKNINISADKNKAGAVDARSLSTRDHRR